MIWGTVLLALANGWRAAGLAQQGQLLLALDSSLNPWLGLALALVWSILFIIAAVALWQRWNRSRYILPALILVHGIYQLLLVLIFARSDTARNAWLLIGLLFMLAALFSVWALCRPSVSWYFK
jgi:hypothetical protein